MKLVVVDTFFAALSAGTLYKLRLFWIKHLTDLFAKRSALNSLS